MSFQDAIRICIQRKYAVFSGRGRRSEYWYFILFTAIVGIIAGFLDAILGFRNDYGSGPIQGVLQLALLVPTLAAGARRLHDTGRSGWWQLISLIPFIGWIVLIVFFVQDSQPANQHGPNPKAPAEAPPPPQQY